jgi:hypothetical protein
MKITTHNFMKILAHDFTPKVGEMYASDARDAYKPVEKGGSEESRPKPPRILH